MEELDATEVEVSGNGHGGGVADEVLEGVEKQAAIDLLARKRGDSSIATMARQQLGVIQRTLQPPEGESEQSERVALLLADMLDDDEALDMVAAIEERKLVGISLAPLINLMLARCAVNRKGAHTNRVAQALEAIGKTTIYSNMGKGNGNKHGKDSITH